MKVSIVIPTYKRPSLTLKLVKQIRKYHPDIEIIVVDQENKKPLSEKTATNLKVKYLNLKRANTSVAKNRGVAESSGDIIIFFDDDVEITKDTIGAHLKVYQDPEVVATAGRVINNGQIMPKKTDVDTGQTNFLATKFTYNFWSTREQFVDFTYGCNMSYKREVFLKTGGFDVKFPKIFEEVDLGNRISKNSGKIKFVPQALVYHHKAPSGGIRPEEKLNKQKLIFKNYGRYLAKNVPFPFSLLSLGIRSITAIKKSPLILKSLFSGYTSYFKTKKTLFFLVILLLISFLRLYKTPAFFSFNFDEEYQASLAWEQVKNFHPIWIGVSASNLNFYLGPGFTYLNAFLFALSSGNPISLAYFAAFFGVITSLSVYYVSKQLFSQKIASLAFIIYGISSLYNFYDHRFWNPTPIPFIALWFYYFMFKAKVNPNYLIPLSLLLSLSLHIHLSLMVFAIPFIYLLFYLRHKLTIKLIMMMIVGFLIFYWPLIIFDINHNYDNLLAPIRYITGQKAEARSLTFTQIKNDHNIFLSTLARIWFISLNTNLQNEQCLGSHCKINSGNQLLILISILLILWFIYQFIKVKKRSYLYLLVIFLLYYFTFILYPGPPAEYYLLAIFTIIPIIYSISLSTLNNKLLVLLLGIFIITNMITVLASNQDKYGLLVRKKLINQISKVIKNSPYSLEVYGADPRKYHPYGGWRYLFARYHIPPVSSFADEHFGWIYQDELINKIPTYKVIVADDIKLLWIKNPLVTFQSGIYYGYIIKN